MTTFMASIFVFGLMIFFHELGHFAVAKAVGIRVLEFSIGMGPTLAKFKRKDTQYTLRALPIGGFVRMAGMDPEEQENPDIKNDPANFNNKTVGQRAAVIFAGSFMNFLLAFLLFIYIYMLIGVPMFGNVIGKVLPDRPAASAGLQAGDKILSVNGKDVQTWLEIVEIIHVNPNKEVQLKVDRQGFVQNFSVKPELDPNRQVGQLGIMVDESTMSTQQLGFLKSIQMGVLNTYSITELIVTSLVQMFTGKVPPEVGGPVMIVNEIGKAANTGMDNLLMLAAVLSINLGIFNLLPIPALDGSRLVFLGVEALRGKPMDPAREGIIHLIGFALLMALMVVIAYKDIVRLIGG